MYSLLVKAKIIDGQIVTVSEKNCRGNTGRRKRPGETASRVIHQAVAGYRETAQDRNGVSDMQLLNGQAQIIDRQIVTLKETTVEAPGRENEDKLKARMFAEMLLELMMEEGAI